MPEHREVTVGRVAFAPVTHALSDDRTSRRVAAYVEPVNDEAAVQRVAAAFCRETHAGYDSNCPTCLARWQRLRRFVDEESPRDV